MPHAQRSNVVAAIAAVLEVLAAALVLAACGGGRAAGAHDREFAFRAVFAPNETSPRAALARTASIIDRRLRARHIEGSARPAGADRVVVRLPAAKRAE